MRGIHERETRIGTYERERERERERGEKQRAEDICTGVSSSSHNFDFGSDLAFAYRFFTLGVFLCELTHVFSQKGTRNTHTHTHTNTNTKSIPLELKHRERSCYSSPSAPRRG